MHLLPNERASSRPTQPSSLRAKARDLVALTKPRITLLVLATGGAGIALAPGHIEGTKLALSLLGTTLIVSSANALNMWWERDLDGFMARTKNRPLPAGRLSATLALYFGLALGAVALPMLLLVNALTFALGLLALVTYVAIYTPLKRKSWMALLVGAVPGAMPPLMGWTSVTGSLGLAGVLLFAVLFLWQIPHFAAITLFRTGDYAKAGMQVIAVQHGERAAKRVIATYTLLLVGATLALHFIGVSGGYYLAIAIVCGGAFLAMAARGFSGAGNTRWAKQLFAYSILYLVVLLGSMLADRIA